MSYTPFGTIIKLGDDQSTWIGDYNTEHSPSTNLVEGQYLMASTIAGSDVSALVKIDGNSLSNTVYLLTEAEEKALWKTSVPEIGQYLQYFKLNSSDVNQSNNSSFDGDYQYFEFVADVRGASGSEKAYIQNESGFEKEGSINISSVDRPVLWLNEDAISAINGTGTTIQEGWYAVIHDTAGDKIEIQQVTNTSGVFSAPGTKIDLTTTSSKSYEFVREEIFGTHYSMDVTTSDGGATYTIAATANVTEEKIGWDEIEEITDTTKKVTDYTLLPLTLKNIGTSLEVYSDPIIDDYDPTDASGDNVTPVDLFIYTPFSGDYYTVSSSKFTATDPDLDATAITADGDYVIHKIMDDHYVAYKLTGSGDMDDPYELADEGTYLGASFVNTEYAKLDAATADGTYQLYDQDNVYEFTAANGTITKVGHYAFYEKDNDYKVYAVEVEQTGAGSAYTKVAGAAEITIASFTAFETLVSGLDASAYVDASTFSLGNGPSAPNGDPGTNESGLTSQTLDADTIIYSMKEAAGVSADGLYVLVGDDTNGYKAHAVSGNQHIGYTVSTTADDPNGDGAKLYANDSERDTGVGISNASNVSASGKLAVKIVNIENTDQIGGQDITDASGTKLDGDYALVLNSSTNKYDAYEVNTQTSSNIFSLGKLAKAGIYNDVATMNAASGLTTVGYLDASTVDSTYYVNNSGSALFDIVQVPGGRYDNIITYGIKLVNGDVGESATLTSMQFNIQWGDNSGTKPEYNFWGQFKSLGEAPKLMSYSDIPTDGTFAPTTFFSEVGDRGLSFGMFDDAGMTFNAGDLVATFMLEKTNLLTSNNIQLQTAQYTTYNAYDVTANASPTSQSSSTYNFDFSNHDLTVKVLNENGVGFDVNEVEVIKTDISTNDGLSIVPVMKNGDIIQYQLVMNVPIPTFIQALEAGDGSVKINPDHKITITGSNLKIFDESIVWLTDIGTPETDSLVEYSTGKSVKLDDVEDTTVGTAASNSYTGHEFLDLALSTTDVTKDLSTSDKLEFELLDLTLPQLTNGAAATDAEGRYILAEFSAYAPGAVQFTAAQKSSENLANYENGSARTITRIKDAAGDADAGSGWLQAASISDGSEVVVLADGWYLNDRSATDAVGAEDALGALRVSRDSAMDAANNIYKQSEIIAADFNLDGKVTAADAYDILQFAVAGPDNVSGNAKWVYIDSISDNDATASHVHYDKVTDTFIGSDTTINATAVLIGDVTSSYSSTTPNGTVTAYSTWIKGIASNGVGNLTSVTTAEDSGVFKVDASGAGLVYLGSDVGTHVISNFGATAKVALSKDVIQFYNGASSTEKFGSGAAQIITSYDSSDSTTRPDIVSTVNTQLDGTVKIALIHLDDSNATTADQVDHHIIAFDLGGTPGTFDDGIDLMIEVEGNPLDLAGDPNSYHSFIPADWTA